MLPDFVTVHRRASTAFDVLSEAERDNLAAKFTALHGLPAKGWAQQGVRQTQTKDPWYVVQVTSSLLAFFSVLPDERFLIEDFVRQELLDRYFSSPAKPVAQR